RAAERARDDDRGGLHAATVPAGCLRGAECVRQAFGQRTARRRLVGLRERVDDLRSREDVALRAVAPAAPVTLPVIRARTIPARGSSLHVEDCDLTRVA